ncbi:MAG: hypothetical protein M3510_03175 [Actinomycetota bacterium]|nr:hypothetical protein [Actinomycetota bacterium]
MPQESRQSHFDAGWRDDEVYGGYDDARITGDDGDDRLYGESGRDSADGEPHQRFDFCRAESSPPASGEASGRRRSGSDERVWA